MQGVGDYIAVVDDGIDRCSFLAIDNDISTLNGVFLDRISVERAL